MSYDFHRRPLSPVQAMRRFACFEWSTILT
jgi:hypothetical protein